jgi:hypothetical protein
MKITQPSVQLSSGKNLKHGDVVISHPEGPTRPAKLAQVSLHDGVVSVATDGYFEHAVAPAFVEKHYQVPDPVKAKPFDLGDVTADQAFAADHAASLPNLGADGIDFNVLGSSGDIGNSWTLAVHQEPTFAKYGAWKSGAGVPVDVNTPKTISSVEEFLAYPGGYQEIRGWMDTQLKKDDPFAQSLDLLENVQKVAVFANKATPTLAAVQTNAGSWLTVVDSTFVEVKSLDQLKGGDVGDVAAVYAKPRFDHVNRHMAPAAGKLLTTLSGNEGLHKDSWNPGLVEDYT